MDEDKRDGPACECTSPAVRTRFIGLSNMGSVVSRLNAGGDGDADDEQGKRKLRFLSKMGSPQPHLRHFCPMCCSHIPRQRMSSSARLRQCLLTWAALQSEVASRRVRILRDISRGRTTKGSMRMRWLSCSVRRESWEKQHMVRMPRRMSSLRGWGEEEKLDQMELMDSRSPTGRASRDCVIAAVRGGRLVIKKNPTCWSLMLVPSSAMR